jgi:hypothetical protein
MSLKAFLPPQSMLCCSVYMADISAAPMPLLKRCIIAQPQHHHFCKAFGPSTKKATTDCLPPLPLPLQLLHTIGDSQDDYLREPDHSSSKTTSCISNKHQDWLFPPISFDIPFLHALPFATPIMSSRASLILTD